jgi:hypothetical protein
MADKEVKVIISADTSQGVAGFNQFNSAMTRTESQSSGLVSKIKTHWLGLSAAIAGAGAVAYKGWDMMGKAADYGERIAGLSALGAQYSMTGTQIVKSMTEASRGLVSMADAADMAAKSTNIGLNPGQMAEFTRVAEQLSDVTGQTIPDAYNTMVNAAAKGRVNSLREMGIIVDLDREYEKHARTLGQNADALSENEKMHIRIGAVLDAGKIKVAALGEAQDTSRDKMDRMVASAKNLELMIGQGLIRVVAGASGAFQWLAAGALTVAAAFPKLLEYVSLASAKIYEWTGQTDRMKVALAEAEGFRKTTSDMMGAAQELTGKAADNFSIMTASVDELAVASKRSIVPTTTETKELGKTTENLIKSWRDMEATIKGRMQSQGLEDLAKQLLDNKLEAEKLKEKFKELPKDIRIKAYAIIDQQRSGLDTKAYSDDAIENMQKEIEFGIRLSEDSIKRASERGEAARDLYKDMRGYEEDYYKESLKLIDDQAGRYRAAGLDEIAITKHVEEEKRLARLRFMRTTDAGTFEGGWSQGMADWKKDLGNSFTFAEDMSKTTARSMSSSFSGLFFDIAKGEIKDFQTYFFSFMDSILKKVTDRMGDMVAQWIMGLAQMKSAEGSGGGDLFGLVIRGIGGLAGLLGGGAGDLSGVTAGSLMGVSPFHRGGIVGFDGGAARMMPAMAWAGAPRYHGGFMPGEKPAILKDDEGVFTPAQMRALGNKTETTQQNVTIVAMDSRSFEDFARRNAGVFQNINLQGLRDGKTRDEFRKLLK